MLHDDLLDKIYILFCTPLENSKYGHVTKEHLVLLKLYDATLHRLETEEKPNHEFTTETCLQFICKLLHSLVSLGAENAIIQSASEEAKPEPIDSEYDADVILLILESLCIITSSRSVMNEFMTNKGLLETTFGNLSKM